NVTIHEGGTALLKCEVDNPSGIVQWVKDGLLLGPDWHIPRFPRYSMVGDANIGEPPYVLGQANCSLVPSVCSDVESLLVTLRFQLIPPKRPCIMEYEADSTVTWVAGKEYTLSCQVNDARPPAEIGLGSSSNTGNEFFPKTPSLLSFRFTPRSSDNRQRLTCRASNAVAIIPAVVGFTMNILFPPQSPHIEGYNDPIAKGKDLQLICLSLSGNPLATLQWLKNDEVISTNWETDEAKQLSRSSLRISIKAEDNMATVSCQALNQVLKFPLQASIVKIIGSSSTQEEKEISLSCSTSPSNPPVFLRWWLGWRELNATEVTNSEVSNLTHGGMITVSNLTYEVHREDNGLSLICEAFNEAIMYTKTASVALRVMYPPQKIWIDVPPLETCFRAGNEVKLTCFASGGNPSPRLEWYKVSLFLWSALSSLLMVNILELGPKSIYNKSQCLYAGLWFVTFSPLLYPPVPPLHATIATTDKELRRGQLVTLNCKSGSSNPPAKMLLPQGRHPWTARSRMGICGREFTSFLSAVPPEFSSEQVHIVQAVEQGAAQLPLLVSASPPEITYHWSFLGEVLLTEGLPRYHLRDGGSLEIWNVTRADAGKYKIHCENTEGHNETTITLDVQYAPSIRSIGDPTFVNVGGSAEIVCQADANPAPLGMFQWRWLADLEQNLEELGIELLSEGLTGQLRVKEAQRTHAGLYECQVDNGISPAARSSARLIVQCKCPTGPGQRKVAATGDGKSQAVLQCSAQGVPKVQFSWAKNGISLDPDSPRHTVATSHVGSLHTSTLTIANVSVVHDYATFTCTASNELGTDTLDIQLLSTSRPDPPTELKVIGVSHNWLALGWTPGFDGGLQQSFRIRYHWPGVPSFLYVDVFPPQSKVFTLTGLQPDTLYNVSVNARNALGESDYADGGAGLSVTTAAQPLPISFPNTTAHHPRNAFI
uniref:NPHS1 adhesion molecule, nephrin n=1 Tax=Anolis carolinensis TaxID=28377 RepID=H9GN95_ANOCA